MLETRIVVVGRDNRHHYTFRYGAASFFADVVLTGLTGGLWLAWVLARSVIRARQWRQR